MQTNYPRYLLVIAINFFALFNLFFLHCTRSFENPYDTGSFAVAVDPSNLRFSITIDGHVMLSWTDNGLDQGFAIIRNSVIIDTTGENDSVFIDSSSMMDKNYSYVIQAVLKNGTSSKGVLLSVPTIFSPTNLIVARAGYSDPCPIKLQWSDNCKFEKGFIIERQIDSTGFHILDSVPVDTTTFLDTSRVIGTNIYRVKAVYGNVSSLYTSPQQIIWTPYPIGTTPDKPEGLLTTIDSSGAIILHWYCWGSNHESFNIIRNGAVIGKLPKDSLVFRDTLVHYDTLLIYEVHSLLANGKESVSACSLSSYFSPNNNTIVTTGNVTITWKDRCDFEQGFIIERKSENGNFNKIDTLPANSASWNDLEPLDGKSAYRVRAYIGHRLSPDTQQVALQRIAVPTNVAITIDSIHQIAALNWLDNSNNEQKYIIQYAADTAAFSKFDSVPANTATYNINLNRLNTANQSHSFRIIGYSPGMTTTPSAVRCIGFLNKQLIWQQTGENAESGQIEFCPDGAEFVINTGRPSISEFEPLFGRKIAYVNLPDLNGISSIKYSHDCKKICCYDGANGRFSVYRKSDMLKMISCEYADAPILSPSGNEVAYSSNYNYAGTGYSLRLVSISDTTTVWKKLNNAQIDPIHYCSNGTILIGKAAGSYTDTNLTAYNPLTGDIIWSGKLPNPTHAIDFSTDGNLIAAYDGKLLHIVSALSGLETTNVACENSYVSPSLIQPFVGFNSSTNKIVTYTTKLLTVWKIPEYTKLWEKSFPLNYLSLIRFSPDGNKLLIVKKAPTDTYSQLIILNAGSGDTAWATPDSEIVNMAEFSPDGKSIITCGRKDLMSNAIMKGWYAEPVGGYGWYIRN